MAWTTDVDTAFEIAAAIAVSPDQITQLTALADALGTGNRTLTIKHADSGSDWENPTFWDSAVTVFQGTITGANIVSAGRLLPGKVTSHGVAAAVNLAVGSAVIRVSNAAGRRVQMPLVLGATEGRAYSPRSPSGLFSYVFNTFGIGASPELATAPDKQLASLTLRNTTASPQAANFVTQTFGQPFVMGDIPAGSYPHFKTADGQTCPATIWGAVSWPDGSMRFCCVMMRVPLGIAASSSIPIQVRSGGSAPAAGTRTISEVTAANLSVEINVNTYEEVVDEGNFITEGTFTASVNSAITQNADTILIADGPAGKIYRVGDHARNGSAVAHGQIYARHYLMLLTNADGTFAGTRHLARVAQPFVTGSVPQVRTRYVTAALKAGATTVRALQGYATDEVLGPNIALPHYGSFMTAGVEARYDFFNPAGAVSTDNTIQIVPDIAYGQLSHNYPPNIRGGTAESSVFNYNPHGKGGMIRYMPGTGGRDDIGLVTAWCARYMANPSATNERALRVNAMCSSGWRTACWKRDTLNIVAVSDTKPAFAGLGTIQTTWRNHSTGGGFQRPGTGRDTSLWTEDVAHRPSVFLVSYLMSGAPHILDMSIDNGAWILGAIAPGLRTLITTRPTKEISTTWIGDRDVRVGATGEIIKNAGTAVLPGRVGAWCTRDVNISAAYCPNVMADGSEANIYLNDAAKATMKALHAYATGMPESHRNDGLFIFEANGSSNDTTYENPWQLNFWNFVTCWTSGIWKTADSIAARQYQLRRYTRAHELFDVVMLSPYRMSGFDGDQNMITSMTQYVGTAGTTLSANAGTNAFTIVPSGFPAWLPTNGDLVAFSGQYTHADINSVFRLEVTYTDGLGQPKKVVSITTPTVINPNNAASGAPVTIVGTDQPVGVRLSGTLSEGQTLTSDVSTITDPDGLGTFSYQWFRNGASMGKAAPDVSPNLTFGWANKPFPTLGNNTRLHVVNASGSTFQLSLTPGGAPLDILANTTVFNMLLQPKNTELGYWPARESDYPISSFGAMSYHQYHGDVGADTVRTVMQPKLVAWGGNPNAVHQHNFSPV